MQDVNCSDSNTFNRLIERAEQDIYLLRQSFEDKNALSAGIPWFSTLFGRDSLITAWQTLILDSKITKDTLSILAQYQREIDDDWREESPRKTIHELRFGEMARLSIWSLSVLEARLPVEWQKKKKRGNLKVVFEA